VKRPFEDIVAEHGPTVMAVCRAVLGPHDADDAWAETFLAALRAYPDLRPDSNVRGWLVTVAHHKAIDQIRATARRPRPTPDFVESAVVAAERDDDLWSALDDLAPKQRAAVTYHHVAGLPYAEIADLLGTTEAAARRNAADGIAALRKIYPPKGTTP
jgi:RNA polymerase sigma factor (sigma-70 family)